MTRTPRGRAVEIADGKRAAIFMISATYATSSECKAASRQIAFFATLVNLPAKNGLVIGRPCGKVQTKLLFSTPVKAVSPLRQLSPKFYFFEETQKS
jgi:hypothetical protein